MTRPRRPVSFDCRDYLVGTERREWDQLNAEADALHARRKEVTQRLNALRGRAWNRRREDALKAIRAGRVAA
ncbi:MAG: hypothetical protein K2Y26_00045 [Gemmatimonadaceae bacterium]|nr:hypothetical protein [Gemmatimonadaceae bacterium]